MRRRRAKKTLGLVGAGTVETVGDLVIDSVRGVLAVQRVPMAGFIGMHGRAIGHNGLHELHAIGLLSRHSRLGAALALARDSDNAALAGLVFGETANNAILFQIGRAHVAADVRAVDFDRAGERGIRHLACHCLTQLVRKHEGVRYCTARNSGTSDRWADARRSALRAARAQPT
jgi:hypothetical protein